MRPGELRPGALPDHDLRRGEDLAVAQHVPGERGPVRPAQRDVEVATRPGQRPHQRADLKMLVKCLDLGILLHYHESILLIRSTLLFPSAGVWLANLMVALVRDPQQVNTKGAFNLFSVT